MRPEAYSQDRGRFVSGVPCFANVNNASHDQKPTAMVS